MNIKTFIVNPLQVNCYVISDPATNDAAIIDPGMFIDPERQQVEKYISDNGLHVTHILLTHGHFDHAMSTQWAYQTYGLYPRMHRADIALQQNCEQQIRQFLHRNLTSLQAAAGTPINDSDTIHIGETELQAIHTPGHTQGGLCFYCQQDNVLFSGDTIFYGSVGRTDLDTGNAEQLIASIRNRIITLPEETRILPGHGPATNVGTERHINPYI